MRDVLLIALPIFAFEWWALSAFARWAYPKPKGKPIPMVWGTLGKARYPIKVEWRP